MFTSAPTAFADSPAGAYPANTDRTLTLTAPLALVGTERLRFQIQVDTEPTYDVATVEAWVGTGAWTPLAGFLTVPASGGAPFPARTPVYTGTQPFRAETVSLAAAAGPSVRLRFRSDASQQRDGVALDDIRVERITDGSGVVASEPGDAGAVAALGLPSPTPARGRVRIPAALSETGGEVSVVDALGREVTVLSVAGGVAEWDAARVAPGVYVVRLRSAQGEASRRVVVR